MNKRIGYLIKVTFLTGSRAGESYLLRKGGYVTKEGRQEWEDTTYKTYSLAERQCKRLEEYNKRNYDYETWERERDASRGREVSSWRVYQKEQYFPYAVEI